MSSMTSSLMFLKIAVYRNSFLRQVQHMGEFDVYLKKAMDGHLGPTVQYLSMYVHMVNRLHRDLMRTLHTNNYVDGYFKILPAKIDIFLD